MEKTYTITVTGEELKKLALACRNSQYGYFKLSKLDSENEALHWSIASEYNALYKKLEALK